MHEFYHRGVVIVSVWCHDWLIETQEIAMTDYNSMKADEYARRQGEIDDMENAIVAMMGAVESELPDWVWRNGYQDIDELVYRESRRRVMQAIKERGEP